MNKNVNWKSVHSKLIPGVFFMVILFASSACVEAESKKKNESETLTKKIASPQQDQNKARIIDQEAVEILQNSLDHLSKLKQFSVQAQSTLEDINESDHRVDFEIASSVIVSRPNKLRSERHSSLYNQIFYYDGSTLTLYNPVQKVYATEAAPGTIEEMFHFARDKFGLSAPISDLIYNNAFDLLMHEVNHAELIGKERIGDVECDHLLFSRPGVDFQIWIAVEGAPLLYKYVVTDTSTPELLAFITVMRNWNVNLKISDMVFNFEAPTGTHKINFIEVN